MTPERAAQWREAFTKYSRVEQVNVTTVTATALSMLAAGRYHVDLLGFTWFQAPGGPKVWENSRSNPRAMELLQELALNAHKVFPPAEESAGTLTQETGGQNGSD